MKTKSHLVCSVAAVSAGLLSIFATGFSFSKTLEPETPLVVHEWGTFTVLQDHNGDPVAGVNINEESLPPFVHQLAAELIPESNELAPALGGKGFGRYRDAPPKSKGITRFFELAIMRMETPILYFYPPGGKPMTVDISVGFRNGWLTEWFPNAENESPGYPNKLGDPDKPGTLTWKGLEIGAETEIPATDEHVWLAPRKVDSARVRTPGEGGQSEQYLFYRGVAQLESPLRVKTTAAGTALTLHSNLDPEISGEHVVSHLWLADIRPDGKVAFRASWPVTLAGKSDEVLLAMDSTFPEKEYSLESLALLRQSMRDALTDKGLFEDEAEAMLETWELSYFKSPGLRLFYILPDAWTDHQLPLEISEPAAVTRVMIGRVELITAKQEALLSKIAAGPLSNPDWFHSALKGLPAADRTRLFTDLQSGSQSISDHAEDTFEIPADYRAYMELGRFRDAILLNRAPEFPGLKNFAENYAIRLNQ